MLSEKTNAFTFYREFISTFTIFSFRFRFFGATGDNANNRNMAGYFGPLFRNFRFYGGRPGEELTRGLLREKRLEEYSDMSKVDSDNKEDHLEDDELWKKRLEEATMNSVLAKMVSEVQSCEQSYGGLQDYFRKMFCLRNFIK